MLATPIDELIESVVAGAPEAWQRFVERAHPLVVGFCQQRIQLAGASAIDTARDVAVRTIDQLHRDRFAALRQYARVRRRYRDVDAEQSFRRWLQTVAYHSYVDWLRSHPEYQRKRSEGGRALQQIKLVSLDAGTSDPHVIGDDVAAGVEIRRILEIVSADIFPADQRRALHMWLMGYSAEEMAAAMELAGPDQARQLLQNARQRLRRQVHHVPAERARVGDVGGKP